MAQPVVVKPQNVVTPVSQDSDGNALKGLSNEDIISVKANALPKTSSYVGDQSIDAIGTAFAFVPGATGIQIKVTHETQTIRVGMGADAGTAEANAALAIAYDINDGIVPKGRRNTDILFYYLLGSGAATTCTVEQI